MTFRTLLGAIPLVAVAAAPAMGAVGVVDNPLQDPPPREVIVRFDPGTPPAERSEAIQSVDALAQRPLTGLPRTHEVTLPAGELVADALAELRARPDVAWAVPNGRSHLLATPDDPMLGSLWAMPGIGASTAWDATQGSADVLVGVVDSGIAQAHPDLAGNLRADLGRNFVPDGATVDPANWNDQVGHGTHVAGTIGAVGNNGLGVAGINWRVGLLPVRAFDMWGSAEDSWIVDGLAWAAQRSRVVNASFESANGAAMDAVIAQYPNTLFVAAAGNSTVDVDSSPSYPCAIDRPNVICVAALEQSNGLASYSNFGARSVDLGAPGSSINSTYVPLNLISDATNTLGTWTQSPAGFWAAGTDTAGTPYRVTTGSLGAGVGATLTSPVLPALAGTSCRLSYDAALNLPGGVTFRAEASTDGVTWTLLDRAYNGTTGGAFYPFHATLDTFPAGSSLRVRFRVADASGGTYASPSRYLAVSSPVVQCMGTQPAGGSYGALSGTSMATPQVAGAAALLLAAKPSMTVAELRSALLSTVAPTAALAGRTVTGGRLDLAAAMRTVTVPASPAPKAAGAIAPMSLRIVVGKGALELVVRKGKVRVPVACAGAVAPTCRMTVLLRHDIKRPRASRIRWRTMASKAATVKAGARATLTLKLNAYATSLLKERGVVTAQLRTSPVDGATGDTQVAGARVSLLQKARPGRR